jgi:PmbA protein
MADVRLSSVAEEAANRSTELLGSRKIASEKVPVVLVPSIAVEFLQILSASVLSESVQKKRSFLAGKVGQSIISPLLNITDDGTLPWGLGTRPADDEGYSTSRKFIVSEGVLNQYLYNTYTAKKDGTASTGNAVRGGFKSLPGVGVCNFSIEKGGGGSLQDMIASIQRGIVIVGAMGVHTANPISGDFSVGISGLWIEKGVAAYPVKEAVLSGNVLDMFNKVEGVGSDLAFYGNTGSPSLLIGAMDISA